MVITQKRENDDRFPFDDVIRIPKPWTHQLRRLWQKQLLGRPITIYRGEARRIRAALDAHEAQLLHIYFGHIAVHLLPLLRICNLPAVVSFHGADAQVGLENPRHRELTVQMLERVTLVLTRSESLTQRLIELGCPPSKLRLHRTGIPLREITFQQRIAPADGAWRCLQASRLIPKKGLRTTLRAFAKFALEYPRATLTVAGEGPQHEELRSLARNLGVGANVFFTGFIAQEKLRALCAESHLFLHPSELAKDGDQEGVPNSMLEAMASGLPVLGTRHGGIPEAVEHDVSGVLVAEHDDAALAQAMRELAAHPERFAEMSGAAARRVSTEFDLAKQARLLESYYDEAISCSPARRGESVSGR